jgi:predicted DCC family thiol-disulfide oxidoreductase YuxK
MTNDLSRPSDARSSLAEPRPIVFYDGGCPLCRREISHYRRLPGAETLAWVDIDAERDRLKPFGLDYAAAMARFHVLDAERRWQTGAWGFAEIWARLPRYRWLARLVRGLHLLPVLDGLYRGWARWRTRRRCHTSSCPVG